MRRRFIMVLVVCLAVMCSVVPVGVAGTPGVTARAVASVDTNATFDNAQAIPVSTSVNVPFSKPASYFLVESASARGFFLSVRIVESGDTVKATVYRHEDRKQVAAAEFYSTDYGETFELEVAQPKGKYYVKLEHQVYTDDSDGDGINDMVYQDYIDQYRYFSFTITPAKPISSVKFQAKSGKLGLGVKAQVAVTVKPAQVLSTDLKWKSSNTKVATVNSIGVITPKKKGKTTITAYSAASSKIKATLTLTVANNVYTTSRPKYGKKKGIYYSAKKIYYKGKSIYADIYFYNKTGVNLGSIREMELYLVGPSYDDDYKYGYKYVSKWTPKGGIRNNSYKVLTVKFGGTPSYKLNLAGGAYHPYVDYAVLYRKSLVDKPELLTVDDREPIENPFK